MDYQSHIHRGSYCSHVLHVVWQSQTITQGLHIGTVAVDVMVQVRQGSSRPPPSPLIIRTPHFTHSW